MSDCFDHAGDAGAFPLGMHQTSNSSDKSKPLKKILVVMDGGNIQDIIGIPEDVQVVVRDYDVGDLSREELLDEIFDENLRFMEARPIGATLCMSSAALCLEHTWAHNKDEIVESRSATEADIP